MDAMSIAFACLAALLIVCVVRWRTNPLYSIPTAGGPSFPVLSYWTAYNYYYNAQAVLAEGHRKFHGSPFKVASLDRWLVIVSGTKMVEDLGRRSDAVLSSTEGSEAFMHIKYTVGSDILLDPYHVGIIRDKLTRSLPLILPDIIEEFKEATTEHIPAQDNEWVAIDVMSMSQQVIARTSNRAFVGIPVCRDKSYLNLMIVSAAYIFKAAFIINMFPGWLKPAVGNLLTDTKTKAHIQRQIQPLLDERRECMSKYGKEWADKPRDMLQWVLEQVVSRGSPDSAIVERLVIVNLAAIHSTSISFSHALYDLAAWSEYVKPMRDEIEAQIRLEGWTKTALDNMAKLDSFLKESQRHNGFNLLSMARKAMKDVTLTDGTLIPKDAIMIIAAQQLHLDETNYPRAHEFDPFRFARMRDAMENMSAKHLLATTSNDYIPFGLGKHACPGRFFVANELKAMLAYIILNYDVKLDGDGKRPPNVHISTAICPPVSKAMFKRRQPEVDSA